MKNKFLFSLLIAFSLFILQAKAQTNYTWDEYNLEFAVPAGFKVSANTSEKFEGEAARSKVTLFGLYPIKDESLTVDGTADAVKTLANEAGMAKGMASDYIEFNGFKGHYAEGTVQGINTFFAVMMDEESDLNFIVTVMHDNTDAAIKLVKSIHKLN
jgi:hypothetical protein